MYTGQVAVISNQETWISDFYQLVDEDTGDVINILNPDIGFDCSFYIRDIDRWHYAVFDIASGKVAVSSADDGPGFQCVLDIGIDVSLCAGTYICGVKTTTNGQKNDLIIGTIAVIEGNR